MDPALEKLTMALEKRLRKGETASAFLGSLAEATELLLNLDVGMIDGAMLSRERREALAAATSSFARQCFDKAVALDGPKTTRWLSGLAVYQKPKTIDFAEWVRLARSAKSTAPPAAPIDVTSPEIPKPLSRMLQLLVRSSAENPESHRLNPPAAEATILEREEELGVALPSELRFLYRLCNGFSLFRREGSNDVDGSPFRLVPVHEVQPFAWATGDELPRKKRNARARRLEESINDPARLQVFDVGNGDFVSCCTHDGRTIWLDDYSDGPQKALTDSIAELLEYALSKDRIDPDTGQWNPGAWGGLSLRIFE